MLFGYVWPSHVPKHVAASTVVARPTLYELQPHQHEKVSIVCVCACTEPAGTGTGAVCALSAVDKRGRKQSMLNLSRWHSATVVTHNKQKNYARGTLLSYDEEALFPWKTKKKRLAHRARAPHYNERD